MSEFKARRVCTFPIILMEKLLLRCVTGVIKHMQTDILQDDRRKYL